MGKNPTIDTFFKKKIVENLNVDAQTSTPSNANIHNPEETHSSLIEEERPCKLPRFDATQASLRYTGIDSLIRDPALRDPIWKYPPNQQDEVRRAYIKLGPYHGTGIFPVTMEANGHKRRFCPSWFEKFPWLEYSPSKDAAFCLPCFLFSKESTRDTFIHLGFRSWKRVMDGERCAFKKHEGNGPTSSHKNASGKCHALIDSSQHISKVLAQQSSQQIANNRLRLETSIFAVRWLTFQGCALRGHDESRNSVNRGNFIEMVKAFAHFSKEVNEVVLDNAPQNASYTSSDTQKEILLCLSNQVKRAIREEIGDAKFCVLVDEARDISKKEQVALVLRFVDKEGFVRERFFGIFHISDTTAPTLRDAIYSILSTHNLAIKNIRGQGYDGASNMSGAWNGLQALVSKDSPCAYYVHCMAHRLQLALVGAAQEVTPISRFFSDLTFIINIPIASSKRSDQLKAAKASEIEYLIANENLETGTGLNQIGSLQRAGDTRWGSHLKCVSSLLNMFSPTCVVLISLSEEGKASHRGEAEKAYEILTDFQFVFILHLMKDVLEITNMLSQALQRKSQDIVNAMHLVSSTKTLLQNLRETGWNAFINKVRSFCEKRNIDIPDFTAKYLRRVPSRHNQEDVTVEHHYRVDIFISTIDSQLHELNDRFNESTVELLMLSAALDPRDGYASFDQEKLCKLASHFYSEDFTDQDQLLLKRQLEHYIVDIPSRPAFKNLTSVSELCQALKKSTTFESYHLIDRLIRLVLTLPVSTASTERVFSAMNVAKTKLRNSMEDDYLSTYLMVYTEREIAQQLSLDSTVKEFDSLKDRRTPFY